jgi:hypothetical protein
MQQRLRCQGLGAVLGRDIVLQAGHDLAFDDFDQTRINRLVDPEERLAIHRVDPVVGRGSQAQPLPCHLVPWQAGLLSVINPDVPVDVEDARLFWCRLHPAPTQPGAPSLGLAIGRQKVNLGAQSAHLRDTIQAQQFPPLARRTVAQGLHRFLPRQRHEGEQHQQTVHAVVALGHRKLLAVLDQSQRQQHRQRMSVAVKTRR